MKKLGIFIGAVVIIGLSVWGYVEFKKYSAKNAVQTYLIEEKNIEKSNIEELDPFIANLAGDKNWLVYVKLKNDSKKYYYYKDSDKDQVVLESAE
ncbi:hypothetical protein KZO01_13730 [Kurthia zopfii]|uniref:Uncharacterized protein DUF3139 n=1 Tax=Kurthia zopfii TaxID=1650 RepID=A0A2U3AB64_9BACL|nr:DUF3139 domain-containing protein [Kurthia zopfii]PWI21772.1 hypothetical protein DF281_10500 [Kurthia zopfii]TDR36024.1 uncharacterized protein DUF3139 [Kurthia zopfii]STX09458.1 Uncharacterised protein [Kurthia zopfii]VEI06504.1 Uncharacterised protein [Kurthia zopfii]GEK31064.1 hypothetical protein KZO01_13730 [Kurthia zopfii]